MADPVSSIRNLGPGSVESYARAGIATATQLRELGPDVAYARLIAAGARPHFIAYYAMVMGLMGRPWNDCQGEEKAALRARFDAICAGSDTDDRSEIEKILNDIGVIPLKD